MTKFIFIPTWRCNLRCPYCDYRPEGNAEGLKLRAFGKEFDIGVEILWPMWLLFLNRFRPYHLEMTGGEPLCYEGLPDLLAHLPLGSSWGITSNTLDESCRRMLPQNCGGWTASYHYHSDEAFWRNIEALKAKSLYPRVTLVLKPDNTEKVKAAMEKALSLKVGSNIHPILKQGFDWKENKKIF